MLFCRISTGNKMHQSNELEQVLHRHKQFEQKTRQVVSDMHPYTYRLGPPYVVILDVHARSGVISNFKLVVDKRAIFVIGLEGCFLLFSAV